MRFMLKSVNQNSFSFCICIFALFINQIEIKIFNSHKVVLKLLSQLFQIIKTKKKQQPKRFGAKESETYRRRQRIFLMNR